MVERYQRNTLFRPQEPRGQLAMAEASESLSVRLSRFTERQQNRADRQVAEAAHTAGRQAGVGQVEVEPREGDTIRDRAFNKGLLISHAAAVQNDIRTNVARLEDEHPADPEAFQEVFEGYKRGLLSKVPSQAQPAVQEELDAFATRARIRVMDRHRERVTSESLAVIVDAQDKLETEALESARAGDEELLEKRTHQLFSLWDEGVETGTLDAAKVSQRKAAFSKELAVQTLVGDFETTILSDGAQAAEEDLRAFRKQRTPDLSPDEKDTVVSTVQGMLATERARANREAAAGKALAKANKDTLGRAVDDATYALDRGYVPENLDSLQRRLNEAQLTPDDRADLRRRLATSIEEAAPAIEFTYLPPSEQEAQLNAMRQDKGQGGKDVKLMERLDKIHARTRRKLDSDPMGLAIEQGIVEPQGELPLDDPAALADAVDARVTAARQAEAHYQRPVSPLTEQEVEQLTPVLERASADDQLALVSAIVDGAGELAPEVLGKLDEKNMPVLAQAGSMVLEGAGAAARMVLRGAEFARENPQVLPSKGDFAASAESYLQGVYSQNPRHHAAVNAAARAMYAELSRQEGDVHSDVIDPDRAEEAMRAVTGGIVTIDTSYGFGGESTIEVPRRGMSASDTEEWVESLTADDFSNVGGITPERAAELTRDGAELMSVGRTADGRGRYVVGVGSMVLRDDQGETFILEFRDE